MAEFFRMPQASPTMTVGVVAKWVLPEGARVEPQTVIAQVETDKATMDVEVFDRGVLVRHLAREGEEVPPNFPIAILARSADEDVSALLAEYAAMKASSGGGGASPPATPPPAAPAELPPPSPVAAPAVAAPAPVPPPPSEPGRVAPLRWMDRPVDESVMEPRAAWRPPTRRVRASPLARALAAERGVDLARVRGSGIDGRIVAADLDAAGTVPAPSRPADEARRVTQMRKTIARRLTEVHQQVPVFYLTVTLDATAFVGLKAAAEKRGLKVSYNDLLLKAVAHALRDVPACNAWWQGDTILQKGAVDIGVAVALPEGLVTPVVRDADRKPVAAIAAEVRELAGRAKDGKLAPEEYTGGTFTVSNLGMFDIDQFTAILNPPESAILAVGRVAQVPEVVGGQVVPAWRMKVTMTCDHRVIDGALGARFLQALRLHVENPGLGGLS